MAKLPQDEQRRKILEGLADGQSLRSICRAEEMPAISTVMEWCQKDAEWAEQYARARSAGDDAMAEDIQDIADSDTIDTQDKKVRIDARKWLLGKRQPKKYGDRTLIGSDPDNPLPSAALDVSKLSDETLRELMKARGATDAS